MRNQEDRMLCNLCGGREWKPYVTGTDRLHGFEGQYSYVRCTRCGLVFMNPQIPVHEIGRFYPTDYLPHQKTKTGKSKKPDPLPLPEELIKYLTPDSRVLDLGCGSGRFLHQLQQAVGCHVAGLDLSPNAARTAQENYAIEVFCGTFDEYDGKEASLNLITASSFLEHVHDPMAVLKKAVTLLRPGGWFWMKTPNLDSFNACVFKEKWYHLDCPRHLFLFSPKTIRQYLRQAELLFHSIAFEKGSKGLLCSLQYVFYGNNYEPEARDKIRKSKLARALISPLTHLCGWMGLGDQMLVTARKEKRA